MDLPIGIPRRGVLVAHRPRTGSIAIVRSVGRCYNDREEKGRLGSKSSGNSGYSHTIILYTVRHDIVTIIVLRVEHRRDVYRDL